MERPIIISAPSGTDLGATSDYTLDLSFGDSGNTFALYVSEIELNRGYLISVDGTEYGGIIDSVKTTSEGGNSVSIWSGRTWHGVLLGRVLEPDQGRDYLTVEGDANDVLALLIRRMGLTNLFSTKNTRSGIAIKYQFDRFCDGYTGIRKMLASSSAKLMIRRVDNTVLMWAERAETLGNAVDTDLIDFTAKRDWRPVNHLVCAGSGELQQRRILHLYADEEGRISKTQTQFGADEVAVLYDYSNAEDDRLEKDGIKKLKEYQTGGSIDVTVRDDLEMYIGDTVVGSIRNGPVDASVTSVVTKKIVKASGGLISVNYEVGNSFTAASGAISGRGESSGSGTSYTAGEGISITGGRISAAVTPSKLAEVERTAAQAARDASDARAEVGGAREKAERAQASADTKISTISATEGISATRAGTSVTLRHSPSEVSAGTYGRGSSYTYWGGSVTTGAEIEIDSLGHVVSAQNRSISLPSMPQEVARARSLATARRISIRGAANGQAVFDGTEDITINVTGDSAAANFLTAYPVGAIFQTTKRGNPANTYGGTWRALPSLGAFTWERIA